VAEVIMILKPGKPGNDKKLYRPISLLPVISKIFEKTVAEKTQTYNRREMLNSTTSIWV
jgi:hypothetical protein